MATTTKATTTKATTTKATTTKATTTKATTTKATTVENVAEWENLLTVIRQYNENQAGFRKAVNKAIYLSIKDFAFSRSLERANALLLASVQPDGKPLNTVRRCLMSALGNYDYLQGSWHPCKEKAVRFSSKDNTLLEIKSNKARLTRALKISDFLSVRYHRTEKEKSETQVLLAFLGKQGELQGTALEWLKKTAIHCGYK